MPNPGMSLVIPIFNMKEFLPELLASLAAQEPTPSPVEIVFVDDGSTDGGDLLVERWIKDSQFACQLIRQSNGGVSRARNAGLNVATGEWVTFPDSDDVLDRRYLERSWRFLQSKKGRRSTVVASRVLRLNDPTGNLTDDHPLRFRFENGCHVVDMSRKPDYFQLHAASSFFRRKDLILTGARFPEGVAASEDAMFIIDHLLASPHARLGVNPAAVYHYRRRVRDSTVARYLANPEAAYLDRFVRYARIMERAAGDGRLPAWLQSIVLYELHWALAPWYRVGSRRSDLTPDLGRRILEAITACALQLDPAVVLTYDATALAMETRLVILALGGTPPPTWVPNHADCFDPVTGLTRWRRWHLEGQNAAMAPPPQRGVPWVRSIVYFAETPLRETYEWREAARSTTRILDRAICADRARRSQLGQRAFALSSRSSDMRVRRVRWVKFRVPVRALVTLGHEALRRSVLSRTRLRGILADAITIVRRDNGDVVISDGDQTALGLVTSSYPKPVMVTSKNLNRRDIAAKLRGGGRLFSADPEASLAVKLQVRPRADRWNLTMLLNRVTDHDDHLALAEVSAIEVVPFAQGGGTHG